MIPALIKQDEQERMATLSNYAILNTNAEERFDRIAQMASTLLNTPMASISLVTTDEVWFKAKVGFDVESIQRPLSFCGHTLLEQDVLIVPDALADQRFDDNPLVINAPYFRAYAGMPLQAPNGCNVGTLCVIDTKVRDFSETEKQLLRNLAAIVVDALESRLTLRQSLREKVKAESTAAVLRQSEAKYRAILNNAVDGIILIKKNGLIESLNPAAESIFGYQAHEILGKNISMLMPEPYCSQHDQYLARYLESATPRIIGIGREVKGLRKNGDTFPMRLAVSDISIGSERLFSGMVHDLSEVRAAQDAVKTSSNLLRSMIDASPEPIFVKDLNGQYILLNQACAEVIQRPINEILYQTDSDLFPSETAKMIQKFDNQVIEAEKSICVEENIPNKAGFIDTYIVTKSPFYDIHGSLTGVVTTAKNITERKLMEARLRESERRLTLSQRFANIGTWDWNVQTHAFYWSDRVPLLLGYLSETEQPDFQLFVQAIHPKERSSVLDAIHACIYQNTEYDIKHRVLWQDGSIHWLHQKGDVICDKNGKPLRMLGLIQDITEFTEAQRQIAAKEARYRAIVDDQTELLCRFDKEGRLTFINKAYAEYFNRPVSTLMNQSFFELIPEEDRETARQMMACLTYENPVLSTEHRVFSGQGEMRWMQWINRAIFDEENNIIEYQSFGIDITERRAAEEKIRSAKEAADKANQAKSEFLSSMSHELRTPLNAILGFAQLLEQSRKDPLSEKQKRHIQHIIKAGKHLLDLINEILDLAKIESGRISLSIEKVDLNHILTECISLVDAITITNQIEIINYVENCPLFIFADYIRIKQVLLNLLSNAIKYNRPHGKVFITTQVIENEQKQQIRLAIQDTGMGIPHAMHSKLFEPFWRLNPAQAEIEGTGIGLTITKRLIEQMHGSIDFESEENMGSTFWVDLPLAEEPVSLPPLEKQRFMNNPFSAREHLFSLLYIEDNPANLALMRDLFEEYPQYRLLCAENATTGMKQARLYQPDLIIMDINLPDTNGIKAVSQLKQLPETALIPVIALSANVMEKTIQEGLQAGFIDYLAKPINISQLMSSLEKILKHSDFDSI